MAFTRYLAEPSVVTFDQRCAGCRQWLNRSGRYCNRCVKSRRMKTIFGALVGVQLAAVAVFVMHPIDWHPKLPVSETTPPAVIPAATAAAGWVYYDVTDPLIGDVSHHARLVAERGGAIGADTGSPAINRGMLELAVSPHYGTAVLLSFPPVQKACSANLCVVRAIFDRQPAIRVPFQDVSTDRASVLMLGDKDGFLANLSNAHDLTIVASLGAPNETVMNFNVTGFRLKMAALRTRMRLAATRPVWHISG